MESGRHNARQTRLDAPHPIFEGSPSRIPGNFSGDIHWESPDQLDQKIRKTSDYLLNQQRGDGHWVGELEGDTILESEYLLLMAYLGEETSETAQKAAQYIKQQQNPDGGWSLYPDGPLEISASVKAYWTLKLTGHSVDADYMVNARRAILNAGGAERVNSFTRYYMALLGQLSYRQCAAVPPEIMLLPNWFPINIYNMSAWSRTILIPLSLLWAFKPVRQLSENQLIEELFVTSPKQVSVTPDVSEAVEEMSQQSWFPWSAFFRQVDYCYKFFERIGVPSNRARGIRKAASWMLEHMRESDGVGAIFPPIIWSIVALKCLGFDDESDEIQDTRKHLDNLILEEHETIRLQPCHSPVWDTALSTIALCDANIPPEEAAIEKASQWLLNQEIRQTGDWSKSHPTAEPSGWCFEYRNRFYPDIDDTAMVLMALGKSLPTDLSSHWVAEFFPESEQPEQNRLSTLVSGQTSNWREAIQDVSRLHPTLDAIRRGIQWILCMQSSNGGWGAFDANNDLEILTQVPFADHNAMIDPPTPDITARILECFGELGIQPGHPSVQKALDYLWSTQELDGSWPGRWGVNYLYGTWQVLTGLIKAGVDPDDARILEARCWLKQMQQDSGGWGESPASYEDSKLKGQGPVTASQTAWALMGLINSGEAHSESVQRGIQFLLENQLSDGTWAEPEFTGTGFPRVFYLKYHYYRIYFPLMALARYQQSLKMNKSQTQSLQG